MGGGAREKNLSTEQAQTQ